LLVVAALVVGRFTATPVSRQLRVQTLVEFLVERTDRVDKRAGLVVTAASVVAAVEYWAMARRATAIAIPQAQATPWEDVHMQMVVWEAHPLCADRAVTADSELPVAAWVDTAAVAAVDTPAEPAVNIATEQMFAPAVAVAVHTLQGH
jgi:hypothetical protein